MMSTGQLMSPRFSKISRSASTMESNGSMGMPS